MLPPKPILRPHQNRTETALCGRDAESMQSESELRVQGLPPRRQLPVPSAHDQKGSALAGVAPQADRVLLRLELSGKWPSISMAPASRSRAEGFWAWATKGDELRLKRVIRLLRTRCSQVRIAGYRGDASLRAMCDLAGLVGDFGPNGGALV